MPVTGKSVAVVGSTLDQCSASDFAVVGSTSDQCSASDFAVVGSTSDQCSASDFAVVGSPLYQRSASGFAFASVVALWSLCAHCGVCSSAAIESLLLLTALGRSAFHLPSCSSHAGTDTCCLSARTKS